MDVRVENFGKMIYVERLETAGTGAYFLGDSRITFRTPFYGSVSSLVVRRISTGDSEGGSVNMRVRRT